MAGRYPLRLPRPGDGTPVGIEEAARYSPVRLTPNWQERLAQVPVQAFWVAEYEPVFKFTDSSARIISYGVALQYGVVEVVPQEEQADTPTVVDALPLLPALATCDRCGQQRPCTVAIDPYLVTVYSEDGPYEARLWCAECLDARRDAI